jgi:hypothetical protein
VLQLLILVNLGFEADTDRESVIAYPCKCHVGQAELLHSLPVEPLDHQVYFFLRPCTSLPLAIRRHGPEVRMMVVLSEGLVHGTSSLVGVW